MRRPPTRGWNSFDSFGVVADEQALLDNLDVFAERLLPHGYDTFVLDAGWFRQYHRVPGRRFPVAIGGSPVKSYVVDEHARYRPAKDMFPSGFAPIVDRCRALGIRFGLHLMRGIPKQAADGEATILGTDCTASDLADRDTTCFWCSDNYGVRPDHPAAAAYYDSVIQLVTDWGVDFLKIDDLVPYPREIELIADAIAKIDRPIELSLSPGGRLRTSDLPTYRRADMLRVTSDVWDRREDIAKSFKAMELWQGHEQDGFAIDLDMIPFGELSVWNHGDLPVGAEALVYGEGSRRQSQFTPAQKRTFMAQRALAASPLFMGGHLPNTPDEDFELLTNPRLLACQANGVMARSVQFHGNWMAFHVADRDNASAGWLGLFNRRNDKLSIDVALLSLDVSHVSVDVEDVWSGETSTWKNRAQITLPADDVAFVRYEAATHAQPDPGV